MLKKQYSNEELFQLVRERVDDQPEFLDLLREFITEYEKGGLSAFLKFPRKATPRQGRPKAITEELSRKISASFKRVDRVSREIFKPPTVAQRENRIKKRFEDLGKQVIEKYVVLASAEALRNAVLAEECGISMRALEEYLRKNQRTIKAKGLLQHPDVTGLTITGHGRGTRIEASVTNLTPELEKALARHRATAKVEK